MVFARQVPSKKKRRAKESQVQEQKGTLNKYLCPNSIIVLPYYFVLPLATYPSHHVNVRYYRLLLVLSCYLYIYICVFMHMVFKFCHIQEVCGVYSWTLQDKYAKETQEIDIERPMELGAGHGLYFPAVKDCNSVTAVSCVAIQG